MTATQPRTDRPRTAWRADPQLNTHQLTHAVSPGRTVAYCGVHVIVIGDPWPDPGVSTPLARCATCTHAVHEMWSPSY